MKFKLINEQDNLPFKSWEEIYNMLLGMKNKKHITVFDIPSGMCLSVENGQTLLPLHPVRDASLTGCCFCGVILLSTERIIPNWMFIYFK